MSVAPALELSGVFAGYGPFRALFGVSLSLPSGASLALLGANGAGKTTIARVASGLITPTEGRVSVGGIDLTGKPPWAFARSGVVHAPEGRSVFATLSVAENLDLALRRAHGASTVERIEKAYSLFPKLGERHKQLAGTLSGGEQRMLALARVMVDEPAVLIADELSLGLAPIIVDEVYEHLAVIRASGAALLIVEQHVGHALAIADAVVVLAHGMVQYDGPVTSIDELRHHILGSAELGPRNENS